MKKVKWNKSWQELADAMNKFPEKLGSGPSGRYTEADAKLFMKRLNTNKTLQQEFLQRLKQKCN